MNCFWLLQCLLLLVTSLPQEVRAFTAVIVPDASIRQRQIPADDTNQASGTTTTLHALMGGGWTQSMGESALKQVETLASRIATSTDDRTRQRDRLEGIGGNVYREEVSLSPAVTNATRTNEQVVWTALASLERDMQMLDTLTGQKPQLSPIELALLSLSVVAAGSGPLLGGHITNFLAPASAAFSASIGIGAEYVGKIAVADGKEIAAATIQCAAEAEGLLANAERTKAITPLCVGIGATGASFALLAPVLMDSLGLSNAPMVTELYLSCPLISVLAAAVASLAFAETKSYAQRATSVGNRRFAKSGLVGRTWLSTTEQMELKSLGTTAKWKSFSLSVLPAPLLGALVPGALPTKTIVVAALAAVQSAYFLTQAEHTIARAQDAVALKARSAAVCDTYANQGQRSAAILPFTSALASLCAAATAAIVELPLLDTLAATGGVLGLSSQIAIAAAFPALASLFAAAASVSKARCEVDAEAATQAASTLALEFEDQSVDDPVLRPFQGVVELIRLTTSSSILEPIKRRTNGLRNLWPWRIPGRIWTWLAKAVRKQFSTPATDTQNRVPALTPG